VYIPTGPIIMGSDPDQDSDAYEDEQPQHEVTLPDFYIARYPVTVSQFRAFVEESDHQVQDPRSLTGIANHPVVYVTWHEALAYCDWLARQLRLSDKTPAPLASLLREGGWRVTLPSEAEWEKAARGIDGRIYPWGEGVDPEKANYGETGIGGTSAVGCFPAGASPYGLLDLSGNVWEWTRSLFKDYPYLPEDGREDLEAAGSRVLRGGALGYPLSLRCAFRLRYDPDLRDYSFGFRVVVSPSTPDR
jgi:formylglycine-generating enzyme required for sulfatase activity